MSIKIALLKSGEQVIADIKELVSDDGKPISFVFSNPHLVKLIDQDNFDDDLNFSGDIKYGVYFSPWIPLSAEKDIAVGFDWVVTIVEPSKEIKTSYGERVYGKANSDSVVDKQFTDN
jgi:hypothetical protein